MRKEGMYRKWERADEKEGMYSIENNVKGQRMRRMYSIENNVKGQMRRRACTV